MYLRYLVVLCLAFNLLFLPSYAADAEPVNPRLKISSDESPLSLNTKAGSHKLAFTNITDASEEEPVVRTDREKCISQNSSYISATPLLELIGAACFLKLVDGLKVKITSPKKSRIYELCISLLPSIVSDTGGTAKLKMTESTVCHPTLEEALNVLCSISLSKSFTSTNIVIARTAIGYQQIDSLKIGQYFSGLCIICQAFPSS